jgi:hypothetical protein
LVECEQEPILLAGGAAPLRDRIRFRRMVHASLAAALPGLPVRQS